MPFEWSLNPYMGCAHRCTFCYVRAFERRADRPSDDRYGASIRVKTNIAEVLDRELSRRSWARQSVAIGGATDPYQPLEGRYRLTRSCLQALARHRTPFGIITRGPLVVRDLDVLTEAARRVRVAVSFSVPTLDDRIWRLTEPGTAPPAARLRALARLADAGVRVSVAIAPILPGISDDPAMIEAAVRAAREAGASGVWTELLHLRPGTREHFLSCVARDFPEAHAALAASYATRAYRPAHERRAHSALVASIRDRHPARVPAVPRIVPEPEPVEPVRFGEQLGFAFG